MITKMQAKTRRERLLMRMLMICIAFGAYIVLRVKPLNEQVARQETLLESRKEDLSKLRQRTGTLRPSNEVEDELKKLQQTFDEEQRQLEGLNIAFIDLNDSEALFELQGIITESARRNGLQILSKSNEKIELSSLVSGTTISPGGGISQAAGQTTHRRRSSDVANITVPKSDAGFAQSRLQRHMFSLRLRGRFVSLFGFLNALEEIPQSVLITRLQISADNENYYNGERLLVAELTFAI